MAGEPLCIIRAQYHTLTIEGNGVLNTALISNVTHEPCNNTKAHAVEEKYALEGEKAAIKNKHQTPEGKFAESKRFVPVKTLKVPTSEASEDYESQLLESNVQENEETDA